MDRRNDREREHCCKKQYLKCGGWGGGGGGGGGGGEERERKRYFKYTYGLNQTCTDAQLHHIRHCTQINR